MARLKSELEVVCPCCQSTLVIDLNLGRVVAHHEPERGNKPELSDAHRLLAEEAARRESIFQQSVDAEKTRGDALSRRFEEALKQARQPSRWTPPLPRPAPGPRWPLSANWRSTPAGPPAATPTPSSARG